MQKFCFIMKAVSDNKYLIQYCEYHGYNISINGKLLLKHYNEEINVDKIFAHSGGVIKITSDPNNINFIDSNSKPCSPETLKDKTIKGSAICFYLFKNNQWYVSKDSDKFIQLKYVINNPIYKFNLQTAHLPANEYMKIYIDSHRNDGCSIYSSYKYKVYYNKELHLAFVDTMTLINILKLDNEHKKYIKTKLSDKFVSHKKFIEFLNMALAFTQSDLETEKLRFIKEKFVKFVRKNLESKKESKNE